jgi:hypothetical protein
MNLNKMKKMTDDPGRLVEGLPEHGHFVVYDQARYMADYFVDIAADKQLNNKYFHHFCGPNTTPGAWCPNCDKPLLKFMDLDASDPRLEIACDPSFRLPLLYCWTCNLHVNWTDTYAAGVDKSGIKWFPCSNVHQLSRFFTLPDRRVNGLPFIYRIGLDGSVTLLQYALGGCTNNFPHDGDYPLFFPGARASLFRISDELEEAIYYDNRQEESLSKAFQDYPGDPRHQVGGEPLFLQEDPNVSMRCPICEVLMPRLASISDDCLDPRGFTGIDAQVIYYFCSTCRVVACFNEAD